MSEQEFKLIHLDSDDENEQRINSMLLKRKYAHIRDPQTNLGRDKNVIHSFEVENKKLEVEKAIYETRAIRAWKEAANAKAKLDEVLGTHDDTEEEEEQIPRKRPRIIGLKKALAKEREQETALGEQLTPSQLLAMEISYDREPWLERENVHLEGQLEKTKRDLDLQKKMAKHYS